MSRYIDADALLNDLQPLFVHNGDLKDEWMSYCVEKIIREQPTTDAVEVVRCEDCKYEDICCRMIRNEKKPNDYCSYGERRENEQIH